jgi:hypothetical protein
MIQGAIATWILPKFPALVGQKPNRKKGTNFKIGTKETAISPIEHACFLQHSIYLSTVDHPYWPDQRLFLGRFERSKNL